MKLKQTFLENCSRLVYTDVTEMIHRLRSEILGLSTLDVRRMIIDATETFKIMNGIYNMEDIIPILLFDLGIFSPDIFQNLIQQTSWIF